MALAIEESHVARGIEMWRGGDRGRDAGTGARRNGRIAGHRSTLMRNTCALRTTPIGRMASTSPYAPIPWQYLGPTNISGRATDIAVADTRSGRRIYAGYATGGVWESDDNGASWNSIFDDYPSTSIGDLAVAPSNPDIVWVGTGESNIFRASMPGVGVYKSTDGGRTFAHIGPHRHPDDRARRRPPCQRRTPSTSRPRATSGPTTRTAASSRRPTAAARGRRCSTAARGPARSTW